MRKNIQKYIWLIGLIGLTCIYIPKVFAQVPEFNIALTITIGDKDAKDGDIMSIDNAKGTLTRSTLAYDARMYGVLVTKPQIVYKTTTDIPISRSGNAYVNVTNFSGPIKRGDYITSSPIAGKGQLGGDQGGYMVGVAMENYDGTQGETVSYNNKSYKQGRVLTAIGIGPASPALIKAVGGILGTLKQTAQAMLYNIGATRTLDKLIRYILAVIVAVTAIYFSFKMFGKNVTKGIEAIGRNPLAKASIQSMIVMNVVLILMVSLGGVVLALVIISL